MVIKLKRGATKIFAIGFKDWVELRIAEKPPKKVCTVFKKSYKVKEGKWIEPTGGRDYWGHYELVPKTKRLKITNIAYVGGRVIHVMKDRRFKIMVGPKLKKGEIYELLPYEAEFLLDYLVGSSHGKIKVVK